MLFVDDECIELWHLDKNENRYMKHIQEISSHVTSARKTSVCVYAILIITTKHRSLICKKKKKGEETKDARMHGHIH